MHPQSDIQKKHLDQLQSTLEGLKSANAFGSIGAAPSGHGHTFRNYGCTSLAVSIVKKPAPAIVLLLCFLQICMRFETPSTLIACLRSRAILEYRISECKLLLLGGNHFGKEQFWYLFFLYCSCCCWVTILRVLRHHLHSVLLGFGWTNLKGECII